MTLIALAAGTLAATASADDSPPYTIPDGPQVPLVAALTLPGHQTLRGVLAHGLVVNLYAYRAVKVRLTVLVPPRTAARLALGRKRVVSNRLLVASKPGTYRVRLRFTHRARRLMHHLRSVEVMLRSTLRANSASSTSASPVKLG